MERRLFDQPNDTDAGTLEELCRRAGVSRAVGYKLAHTDQFPIPVFRVGRQFRYSRRAWEHLMDAQHGGKRGATEGRAS